MRLEGWGAYDAAVHCAGRACGPATWDCSNACRAARRVSYFPRARHCRQGRRCAAPANLCDDSAEQPDADAENVRCLMFCTDSAALPPALAA